MSCSTSRIQAGGALVIGCEHRSVDARHRVEGSVGERQVLGVCLDELDFEALGPGTLAAAVEELGNVVGAGCPAAEARGRDRGVAAAGGHVEDAPAGPQVGGVDEALGHGDDRRGDLGEVAARPGRLLAGLDGGQIRGCVHLLYLPVE